MERLARDRGDWRSFHSGLGSLMEQAGFRSDPVHDFQNDTNTLQRYQSVWNIITDWLISTRHPNNCHLNRHHAPLKGLRDDAYRTCREHKVYTTLTLRLMNPLISKTCTLKVNRSTSPKLKASWENDSLKTPIFLNDTSVISSWISASNK